MTRTTTRKTIRTSAVWGSRNDLNPIRSNVMWGARHEDICGVKNSAVWGS